MVSCVEAKEPHRVHPHAISGSGGQIRHGVFFQDFPENLTIVFRNIGISCTKKSDVAAVLARRKSLEVDPFNQGFAHANEPKKYRDGNVTSLRLCFQVTLAGRFGS